jgi:hypothetical protein
MRDLPPSREFANALAWAFVSILFAIVGTCVIGVILMIKELF